MNDAVEELRGLPPDELEELLAALARRAVRIAHRKQWHGNNPMGQAEAAEDFVYDVVVKVVTGRRQWTRRSGHTIRQHLFRCVDSEVDNMAMRHMNRTRAAEAPDADGPANLPSTAASPEERVVLKEWAQQLRARVEAAAADDVELRAIMRLWWEGYETPSAMAAELGWPVASVYRAVRKLRRRIGKQAPRQPPVTTHQASEEYRQ